MVDKPAAVPEVFWFRVGNVQLVSVPELGVPSAGAERVGELAKTIAPEPVRPVMSVNP